MPGVIRCGPAPRLKWEEGLNGIHRLINGRTVVNWLRLSSSGEWVDYRGDRHGKDLASAKAALELAETRKALGK